MFAEGSVKMVMRKQQGRRPDVGFSLFCLLLSSSLITFEIRFGSTSTKVQEDLGDHADVQDDLEVRILAKEISGFLFFLYVFSSFFEGEMAIQALEASRKSNLSGVLLDWQGLVVAQKVNH